MAYVNEWTNGYEELDLNTKLRFMEIELMKAENTLQSFLRFTPNSRALAHELILRALGISLYGEKADQLERAFRTSYFVRPKKSEMIQYLLFKGTSYGKISKFAKVSFTTVNDEKINFPRYYPIYPHWEPEHLEKWEVIKGDLNIWSEQLAHSKPWSVATGKDF